LHRSTVWRRDDALDSHYDGWGLLRWGLLCPEVAWMGVTAPVGVGVMRLTRTAVADFCACVA
jgi:hypothetical protein